MGGSYIYGQIIQSYPVWGFEFIFDVAINYLLSVFVAKVP